MTLLFLTESYLAGVFLDYYRQSLVDTLASLGFAVHVVKTNVPGVTADFMRQVCQTVQPDVVLSINAAGVGVLPPTLTSSRLLWFIDSYDRIKPEWVPFFEHRGQVFLTGINRYVDRFLACYPALAGRVHTVPFGAAVSVVDWPDFAQRDTEVFFVGTAFGGAHNVGVLATALAKMTDTDRSTVCDALHHHQHHYDFTIGDVLKTRESPKQKPLHTAFQYRCLVDDALSVQKRMHYLAALADTHLRIYGDACDGWIAHILMTEPALLSRFAFQPITDPLALAQYYAHSKIALNIQHHQAFDFGLSWRVFDIMACGSLLLTEGQSRVPLNALGFEENVHYVAFDSAEELRQKVSHYLSHPEQATGIIQAAYNRVCQAHLLSHRVTQLLAISGIAAAAQPGCVTVVDVPYSKKGFAQKPGKLPPVFHIKTRVGRKYYLKLELLHQ